MLGTRFWTSSPSEIVLQLYRWIGDGVLLPAMGVTLLETISGFVIGASLGAVVGFALGWWPRVGDVLQPVILPFYALPKTALAPLFVLWFGVGILTKTMFAALLVFFLVFFTTYQGTRKVDRDLVVIARVLGARRVDTWRTIALPSAAVWVFSGLRIGLPYAFRGAIVGEFIAASEGVGFLIRLSGARFNTAGVLAGVVVLIVVSAALLALMKLIEQRVLRWQAVANEPSAGRGRRGALA